MSDYSSSNEFSSLPTLRRLLQLILAQARNELGSTEKYSPSSSHNANSLTEQSLPEVDKENLFYFFHYIDETIIEDSKALLADPETKVAHRYIKDIKDADYIALLAAWNASMRCYGSILEGVIEALVTGLFSLHHQILIAQIGIVYALESQRASDVVHLVITYLDTAAQREIQSLVEEYHSTLSQRDIVLRQLSKDNNIHNEIPTLDLQCLTQSSSHASSLFTLNQNSETSSHYGICSPSASERFHNTSRGVWKKRYFLLKTNFDELDMLRENLIKQNEKLQQLVQEKQQNTECSLKQYDSNPLASQTALTNEYRLETEILSLRQKLEEAFQSKKETEKVHQAEIQRLKDENQLYLNDAQQLVKLKASLEKYKVYANELVEMKIQNQQLEKKIHDYLEQLVSLEEKAKSVTEIRHSCELYKNKLNELEKEKLELSSLAHEQKAKILSLTTQLEQSETKHKNIARQLLEMENVYKKNIAELQSTCVTTSRSDLWNDDNLHERIIRLEKENELLRTHQEEATPQTLCELKFQLEDLQRSKEILEKQYQLLLQKTTDDSKKTDQEHDSELKILLNNSENKVLLLQAQYEALENINKRLEAQVQNEKLKSQLAQETASKGIESQHSSVIASLNEQLQLREKQLRFITLSRNEELIVHRREQRLMSLVFHHLGCLFLNMKTNKTCMPPEGSKDNSK